MVTPPPTEQTKSPRDKSGKVCVKLITRGPNQPIVATTDATPPG